MHNHPYGKGLSQSLYNSSYVPGRSSSYYGEDYNYGKMPAKDPAYVQNLQRRSYYADDYTDVSQNKPPAKVWSDYIPIEKRYLDYVPQQKIEYMPVERNYTDYLEVEHQMDYVPVPKLNRHIEYIPVEKYDQSYDYYPYEKSYVKGMGGEAPRVNAPTPGYQGYTGSTNYGTSYGGYSGGYGGGYNNNYSAPSGYYANARGYTGNNTQVPSRTTPPNGYGYGAQPELIPRNYPGNRNYGEGYWQNKY